MLFSAVLSTEGRVVGLCWAKLKPKGPKGLTKSTQQSHPLSPLHEPLHGELNAIRKQKCSLCSPFYGRTSRWAMVGAFKT